MPGIDQINAGSTDVTITTTTETVIVTLGGVSPRNSYGRVILKGWAQITSGAAATAMTLRIRRDSVTGGVTGEANAITLPSAAGGTDEYEIITPDNRGDGTYTYVLTAQQTAATGNGTALQYYLEAITAP